MNFKQDLSQRKQGLIVTSSRIYVYCTKQELSLSRYAMVIPVLVTNSIDCATLSSLYIRTANIDFPIFTTFNSLS
jgi:hypothetical protein